MENVLAEFSITPMTDADMRPFVDTALNEIKKQGLKYEVGPVATTIEGDLDRVLDAIKHAHQSVLDMGVERVITDIRLDEKKDGISIEEEVKGYR